MHTFVLTHLIICLVLPSPTDLVAVKSSKEPETAKVQEETVADNSSKYFSANSSVKKTSKNVNERNTTTALDETGKSATNSTLTTSSVNVMETVRTHVPITLTESTTTSKPIISTTNNKYSSTSSNTRRTIPVSEMELNRPYKKIDKFFSKSEFYRRKYDKKHKMKAKSRSKTEYIKNFKRPIVADVNKNRPIIKDKDELEDCPRCRQMKMTMMQLQINRRNSLKQQLVQKLRLENAPKLRETPAKLPKKLLQRLFQDDESEKEDDNFYAKTVEIFILGHDVTHTCAHRKSTGCYKFDYKNKIEGKITTAELLVYKFRDGNDGQQTILVSELEKSGRRKLRPLNMVTRLETDVKEGWVSFPIEKTVTRWIAQPEIWSGALQVKCKSCLQTKHRDIFGTKGIYRPMLVVRVQPVSRRRLKRGLDCSVGTDMCCKMDFYITFHDIEMYRIIQPRGIWANYCTGSCNVAVTGYYNHTRLIQGVRWRDDAIDQSLRSSLEPCCGPVVLKTLSMLYVDNEGVIKSAHVPNIAIEECGCL